MTRGITVVLISLYLVTVGCSRSANPSNGPIPGPGRQLKPSDFPNVTNSIYGAWSADTADFGGGLVYLTTLYFNEQDQIGVKRTCVGSGEEVQAAAVVSAQISSGLINIRESATVTEKGGRISDCTLVVNEGSFSYTLAGDRLDVSFQPGETKSFTRVKDKE